MAGAALVEREFTCAICGDIFRALAGPRPVPDAVCTHCGLKYSVEERQERIEERRQRRGR